jgi:hypothetical protein
MKIEFFLRFFKQFLFEAKTPIKWAFSAFYQGKAA